MMHTTELQEEEVSCCAHCGQPALFESEGKPFCCNGCKQVYTVLHELSLDAFYLLRSEEDRKGAEPPAGSTASYEYFNDDEFRNDYLTTLPDGNATFTLTIGGIHCTACIWLLEQLPRITEGVIRSELVFDEAKLSLTLSPTTKLSTVAESIEKLGYKPTPLKVGEQSQAFEQESLQLLFRFGVAAVSAGNCMMIAISLYEGGFSGIESRYESFFIWISALLAAPAIIYSAQPFYKAAFNGLKNGILHVDLPISIGVLFGYLLSIVSALKGKNEVYFDSLTILIFLILGGRILQRLTLRKTLSIRDGLEGLLPAMVTTVNGADTTECYRGSLRVGDVVLVARHAVVPADGVLLDGQAEVDLSILSGESESIPISAGEMLYAGSVNLGSPLKLSVRAKDGDTRLAHSLTVVPCKRKRRSSSEVMLEAISRRFVFVVLTLSLLCFCFWFFVSDLSTALQTTLAFVVVTCPCALGLSAPLVLARGVSDARKNGIIVSDPSSFERFWMAKALFFDKTGTLTKRNSKEVEVFHFDGSRWQPTEFSSDRDKAFLSALQAESAHPVGRALRRVAGSGDDTARLVGKRLFRTGVRAIDSAGNTVGSGNWSFLQRHFSSKCDTLVELQGNGSTTYFFSAQAVYAFRFREEVEDGVQAFFKMLREQNKKVTILSGDSLLAVKSFGAQLGLEPESLKGDLSPEQKAAFVSKQGGCSVMIGDGANDSASMIAADLGIGVSGGAEQVLRVAEVFISSGGVRALHLFARGSENVVRTLKRSFRFALLYNLTAGGVALCGFLSPLLAAILMPLSSFTVITIAIVSRPFKDVGK